MEQRAFHTRRRLWLTVAAVMLAALLVPALSPMTPVQADAAAVSFVVDDLTFNTKDATPGDGACRTASGTCTLRAALEEANQLAASGSAAPVSVTMKPGLAGTIVVKGNSSADKMYSASSLTNQGDNGAYYWVTAPDVTIDFGGTVSITPYDDGAYGTAIYADAPRLTVQNFPNLVSAETSIVASAKATGLLLRNGTFDNSYEAERALWPLNGASDITLRDIHVGELYGDSAIELPSGATVTNLTLERVVMDNGGRGSSDHYYGIYGRGSNKLVNLTVTGSTFSYFKSGQNVFRFTSVTLDGARIEGNRFLTNYSGLECVIYITPPPTGNPSVIRNNYFDNSAGGDAARGIYLSMGMSASAKNPLTITDNYFVGYKSYASIYLNNVGTLTTERNRFGTPSYGLADSKGEIGDNAVMTNTSTSSNGRINPWYPTAATYLPEQCAIDVTVQSPASPLPTTPVTLDAYFTAADDAEVYLGRVEGVTTGPTTVRFPYSLGSGNLRLQTKDAQGRSSQYSRVLAVTASDACGPAVSVEQASWQADPTNRRDMQFVATFTEPVATPGASAFSLAGSTAPGARVTDITQLDPLSYLVTVRVDGSGTATLSMPAGAVTDAAGNPNSASTSVDATVTFSSPLALAHTEGELTSDSCASYQITEVPSQAEGSPVPAAPIAIALTARSAGIATLSPNPAIIEPGQQAVTVTACAADGATIKDGTLLVGHTVTSDDPAFDGLYLADAEIPVADTVPHWTMTLSATPASGSAVRAGDTIAYTLTVTHRSGRPIEQAPTFDLSGALDDVSWLPGSLTVVNDGQTLAGTSGVTPSADDVLAVPPFTLEPGTSATITFRLRVEDPADRSGDKLVKVSAAAASGSEPDACDSEDHSGADCRSTQHPIAAVQILKTGPATVTGDVITDKGAPAPTASPAIVRPGHITWAYTVTNIGAVPLTSLAVTDDQGVAVSCPATTLAPGADMVCHGSGDVG